MTVTILKGDCREVLRTLPDDSVHCVVTSPPYWGLRDYGIADQIGLELSPEAFVAEMVGVFREVRRALRKDGTCWLNLGDSYMGGGRGGGAEDCKQRTNVGSLDAAPNQRVAGYKQKDLVGAPWMVAFALRADGWYLRQDIIWSKPNPMPESVRDRCTKAHEYLFLLSKSERYHYDQDAIAEAAAYSGLANQDESGFKDPRRFNGKHQEGYNSSGAIRSKDMDGGARPPTSRPHSLSAFEAANGREYATRNKRSVWEIPTAPYSEAHFATFPPALIEPCILAGCPKGGTVLDPFGGAGTTGLVADRLGRDAILIELNPEYAALAERRIRGDAGMFASIA
jgi:DNA modification methylase